MDWQLPFASGRQPVLARNAVACSQPLAAQAGARALQRGGNAIDAALAAAITLTVVEPVMNGIGGDAFALVWDGQALHGLNASGRAPMAWSPERFAGLSAMPMRGWESVTVPGGVSGWVALSARFGRLPFADLFTDATAYARDGFPVSPVIARQWAGGVRELAGQPGFEAFMRTDAAGAWRAPRVGELWRMPEQAQTLAEIAATNGEAFYRGRLARAITDFAAQHGAALSLSDLDAHQAEWVQPLAQSFAGSTVHELPPNGQGLAALMALGLIEHLPYGRTAPGSAERMHLEIEVMRVAFADLYAHVGDPAGMTLAPEQLLAPGYLAQRAAQIDLRRAGTHAPGQPASGGTVYLCTADAEGRMVSFIQSNYKGFGSGVVVPGTGIALHNRGMGFVTTPGHVNQVAGGKRPLHSIIPAFVTRDARPVLAFGVMGGNMQAQGHVQMVLRHVVEGRNPQASADAPRWRIDDAGQLTLEAGVPHEVVAGLQAMGHAPRVMPADSLDFGSAQLIARLDADTAGCENEAVYVAGSDPRRDGLALGV